ncbi:MAG: hypothetical protein K2O92_02650 [Lachnospiraceae bacterium]|nr:hypothetical protein [Lachnospiraceae bacterium]
MDYSSGLKKNQKMLYKDVKLYMEEKDNGKEMEIYTTVLKEWKPALGTGCCIFGRHQCCSI